MIGTLRQDLRCSACILSMLQIIRSSDITSPICGMLALLDVDMRGFPTNRKFARRADTAGWPSSVRLCVAGQAKTRGS
jgi:hypothetical protein